MRQEWSWDVLAHAARRGRGHSEADVSGKAPGTPMRCFPSTHTCKGKPRNLRRFAECPPWSVAAPGSGPLRWCPSLEPALPCHAIPARSKAQLPPWSHGRARTPTLAVLPRSEGPLPPLPAGAHRAKQHWAGSLHCDSAQSASLGTGHQKGLGVWTKQCSDLGRWQ